MFTRRSVLLVGALLAGLAFWLVMRRSTPLQTPAEDTNTELAAAAPVAQRPAAAPPPPGASATAPAPATAAAAQPAAGDGPSPARPGDRRSEPETAQPAPSAAQAAPEGRPPAFRESRYFPHADGTIGVKDAAALRRMLQR
jgi:hypothetical protein